TTQELGLDIRSAEPGFRCPLSPCGSAHNRPQCWLAGSRTSSSRGLHERRSCPCRQIAELGSDWRRRFRGSPIRGRRNRFLGQRMVSISPEPGSPNLREQVRTPVASRRTEQTYQEGGFKLWIPLKGLLLRRQRFRQLAETAGFEQLLDPESAGIGLLRRGSEL